MGDRFLVVPVECAGSVPGQVGHSGTVAVPAPDPGGSGSPGIWDRNEALEDSVFEPADADAVVHILEYNREPNKYGKTALPGELSHFLSRLSSGIRPWAFYSLAR